MPEIFAEMKFKHRFRPFGFIVLILFPAILFGQYFNLGQDPASLKWRQIETDHFRLIYPENFEHKAQKMMPALNFANANATKTLAYAPKQVPFVIHNYNTISNAVTAWAPKRVEIFTTPPQDTYAQDWLNQLVLHEYRHVVQIDRTNQGFTKVLSWFTGEQAATMINGLFVPSWFMEGDAVCTETALSRSGRGRMPAFEMLLKAQVSQKGAFSYDKAALGSYNTFVPNQYVLGYSMVANVRRKYGYQAWINALDEVARKPYIITPFNRGLKKSTGYGKEDLYRMTMFDMDSLWKYQDAYTIKTDFDQLTIGNSRKYENYKLPFYLNDTLVVTQYSSQDDITRFELTGPGEYRQLITTPGFLSSEIYSVVHIGFSNDISFRENRTEATPDLLLAWTETINDLRWGERNYSVIRVYDSRTGNTREISKKSRYFAPAFSPDGRLLAVVTVDPESHSSMVLIDVETGKETDTIISSDADFYMTPSWSEDGKKLVFTKLDDAGKSIIFYDFEKRNFTTLLQPTFIEISGPVFANNCVLFTGSFSGIENIYAVQISNKAIFQVTSARFGACNADLSPNGSKIVYSDYSSGGYSLAQISFNPESWKKLNEIRDFSPSLYKYIVTEETGILENSPDTNAVFHSQPYRKNAHIFNFHSWAPAYINYMSGENGAGISFMSQNDLSTATAVVGYKYDMAENTGKVTLDFSWQAWYPMIDINTSYGARTGYTDSAQRYNFNETILSGGVTLPLIFTGGKYYKGIRLQYYTSFYNITDNTSPLEDKLTGTIYSLDYNLYAYRYIKQSYKDLYPRWGQSVTLAFSHSPFGENDYGNIASALTRLYFPGVLQHHGIRLDFNWQHKLPGTYSYSNRINLPRGYTYIDAQTLTCFALNYKFPFAYPDFSLGPLAYFKRLKANLFYDGGIAATHGENQQLQSTGVEITSDLHLLRFIFPIDLGFRFGYLPDKKHYFVNLLFSVNLSN